MFLCGFQHLYSRINMVKISKIFLLQVKVPTLHSKTPNSYQKFQIIFFIYIMTVITWLLSIINFISEFLNWERDQIDNSTTGTYQTAVICSAAIFLITFLTNLFYFFIINMEFRHFLSKWAKKMKILFALHN